MIFLNWVSMQVKVSIGKCKVKHTETGVITQLSIHQLDDFCDECRLMMRFMPIPSPKVLSCFCPKEDRLTSPDLCIFI